MEFACYGIIIVAYGLSMFGYVGLLMYHLEESRVEYSHKPRDLIANGDSPVLSVPPAVPPVWTLEE